MKKIQYEITRHCLVTKLLAVAAVAAPFMRNFCANFAAAMSVSKGTQMQVKRMLGPTPHRQSERRKRMKNIF